MKPSHILINKTIFFPKQGILAVGDLHLGYEDMAREKGFMIPETQIKETIKELKQIFKELKTKKHKLKKVIFLGDVKHYFSFKKEENYNIFKVIDFVKKQVGDKNLIILLGNHDKFTLAKELTKEFYIEDKMLFIHGDKDIKEILKQNKVNTIVAGHMHPAIILKDKSNVKKEKFKCYLAGKWKRKQVFILPSFPNYPEGTDISRYGAIPGFFFMNNLKSLRNFSIHIIGKDKTYEFGKVKDYL